MKKIKKILIIIILLIVDFSRQYNVEAVPRCPVGMFVIDSSYCESCKRGYFCPGDSLQYSCPPGTIAPDSGSSSCTACAQGTYSENGISCSNCEFSYTENN